MRAIQRSDARSKKHSQAPSPAVLGHSAEGQQRLRSCNGRCARSLHAATGSRPGAGVPEVGKALGLPEDVTGSLASMIWGWSTEGVDEKEAKELNLNLEDRRLKLTVELAKELI